MFITPSRNNAALAAAVNNRIRADGSMIAAKAVLWRLTGVGVLCLMAGCGLGAVLFGYAQVTDGRTSADKMAAAFAVALEHANLGSVRLNPDSTVKLDPTATVRLDPAATVRVDAGATVPMRPSERQLRGGSEARTVTNYTIFKQVPFGKGAVYTGWDFNSSSQDRPDAQFCYYAEQASKGGEYNDVVLGRNGQPQQYQPTNAYNIDAPAAYQQCVWFR
ncbi:hypothetical protein [Rhodopila sp.]|uniref:hypothetical protein n=1 Tax=Rhodopila sp. TaxID=2480087 RepID=UPI003D12C6E3